MQLHFLNSTHRLSTVQPGINPREKMVLKSILMTTLPLLRRWLMPAQKTSTFLNLFSFNRFEFLRKGFHLEEKEVGIPKSAGNGSFGVIHTRGLDSAPGHVICAKCVSPPPLSCLSQLKRSLRRKSPCISWNATGVSQDVIN